MPALELTLNTIADPTRRGIVERLAEGTATVNELVECFDLTQPTISSHLKVLEQAGLISRTRVAQTRPCSLEPRGFEALGVWLGQLRTVYEQNYARLDQLLDEMQQSKRRSSR